MLNEEGKKAQLELNIAVENRLKRTNERPIELPKREQIVR